MQNKPKKPRFCRQCKAPLHPLRIGRLCSKCQLEKKKAKQEKHKLTKVYQVKIRKDLIKKLDNVFSLFIRQRDGDCVQKDFTCKGCLQNGHVIRRGHMSIRFDEKNCNCQCSHHNYLHNEQPDHYINWFISKYGSKEYQNLYRKSKEIKQWTISELEEKIVYYSNKLKSLQ